MFGRCLYGLLKGGLARVKYRFAWYFNNLIKTTYRNRKSHLQRNQYYKHKYMNQVCQYTLHFDYTVLLNIHWYLKQKISMKYKWWNKNTKITKFWIKVLILTAANKSVSGITRVTGAIEWTNSVIQVEPTAAQG